VEIPLAKPNTNSVLVNYVQIPSQEDLEKYPHKYFKRLSFIDVYNNENLPNLKDKIVVI
jgi:pantothenate synthetase